MEQGLIQGQSLHNGTYRIEKVLGQGSFGITYLAKAKLTSHGALGTMVVETKVAVKEFFMREINTRQDDGSRVEGSSGSIFTNYRKKFGREAENLSGLSHPNIVNVLDIFEENDTIYYVMEFIEGTNLDEYIRRHGPLSETEAISLIRGVGEALSYMHSRQMLHLDVKPKNIMRRDDGSVCLIDFGLSKQFTENGEPESSTTLGLGTQGYAPIEQARYKPDGTFPATLDVYALGATLFKMLTGHRPPDADAVLNEGFPDNMLDSLGISKNTIAVVEKAMQPSKKKRYQNVKAFLEGLGDPELDEATVIDTYQKPLSVKEHAPESSPNQSPDPPALKSRPEPATDHRGRWIIIIVVLLAVGAGIGAGVGVILWQNSKVENLADNNVAEILPEADDESISVGPSVTEVKDRGAENNFASRQRVRQDMQQQQAKQADKSQNSAQALTGSLSLGYATWTGEIKDGKPHGKGRMTFSSAHRVASSLPMEAGPGEYIEGVYERGRLVSGKYYDSNGNFIKHVIP